MMLGGKIIAIVILKKKLEAKWMKFRLENEQKKHWHANKYHVEVFMIFKNKRIILRNSLSESIKNQCYFC